MLIYALACLLAYGSFLIELRRRALANRPVLRPFLLYSASYLIFALLLLYFLFKRLAGGARRRRPRRARTHQRRGPGRHRPGPVPAAEVRLRHQEDR